TEVQQAVRVRGAAHHEQFVVDLVLVHRVEAEQAALGQRIVHAGDAGGEPFDAAGVVQGIQEAGDQVLGLVDTEVAHVLPGEAGLGAAGGGDVQHRRLDVQAAAAVAGVDRSEEHTSELQ